MMTDSGFEQYITAMTNLTLCDPLGYYDFGKLVSESKFVLTDSGGIQEETTIYGIPCITLRENTERPITISEGTNELAGSDTAKIVEYSYKFWMANGKAEQHLNCGMVKQLKGLSVLVKKSSDLKMLLLFPIFESIVLRFLR